MTENKESNSSVVEIKEDVSLIEKLKAEFKKSPALLSGMIVNFIISVAVIIVFSTLISGMNSKVIIQSERITVLNKTSAASNPGSMEVLQQGSTINMADLLKPTQNSRPSVLPYIPVQAIPGTRLLQSTYTPTSTSTSESNSQKKLVQKDGVYTYEDLSTSSSCDEYLRSTIFAPDGIYTITINGIKMNVLCHMRNGEGWMVFQHRIDGSQRFNLPWLNYKNGFGNMNGEFWFGLDKLNFLTSTGSRKLRIVFRNGMFESSAQWEWFKIYNETNLYKLEIGAYDKIHSAFAYDFLSIHNGYPFSTIDRDNDSWNSNCAAVFVGAWWYTNCHHSHLNGVFGVSSTEGYGISVYTGSYHLSLTYSAMMLK